MKPKTIAIVTNNYKPYSGGVVSSIVNLTNELRAQGHKVYIITLEFLDNHEVEEGVIRLSCPLKFKYHGNNMAIPWRPCHNLCKIFEEIKPDVVHSQHPFYLGHCALKAARCNKIPIVFTYHTQYEKYVHYLPFPERLSAPVAKLIALDYCKRVDAIVAPSQSIADFLLQEKITTTIKIIPSGINPIFFTPAKHPSIATNGIIKLITVSRFVKEKNIPFLLEVFSKLDQNKFEFTLVGFGPELDALKEIAYKKLKLSTAAVKFIIAPEKEALVALYQQADLFLFASKTETQGLVLAEAMACGVPAIALCAPGAKDIIKNGCNGFLVNSQEEMAYAINKLANSFEELCSLKKLAAEQSKNYSTANFAHNLIELYKQLC